MKKLKINILVFLLLVSLILSSCHPNMSPKEKINDALSPENIIEDIKKENMAKEKVDSIQIGPEPMGILVYTEPYRNFRGKMDNFSSYEGDYNTMDNETFDLRGYDLSNLNLSKNLPELLYSIFDSTTIWPEKMPEEFIPDKVMEIGKNPGLNIRNLHEKGLDGKGISIGIIDGPLLTGHNEYKDSLVYYNHIGPETLDEVMAYKERFHGNAVASLLSGKSVGVAPGVNLYYVAASMFTEENHLTYEYYAQAIHKLLDLNKQLSDQNKIRAISISWGLGEEGILFAEESIKAITRALDENVPVFFPGMYRYMPIHYSTGADRNPLENPDKTSSYSLGTWTKENYNGHKDGILFPMDSRSFASQTGAYDYVWMRLGGWSWVMPYMTGLYAISLQIDPTLTISEFSEALITTVDTLKVDNLGSQVPILLVNPVKLTEYLSETE